MWLVCGLLYDSPGLESCPAPLPWFSPVKSRSRKVSAQIFPSAAAGDTSVAAGVHVSPSPRLNIKGLVAGSHSFCLFFIFYNIQYRHSFNNIHTIHLSISICWGLSPSPHRCISSVEKTLLWCRAENRTRACLTASRRATNWATPHHMSHAAPWNTPHHRATPHHKVEYCINTVDRKLQK